jgi:WD40 repeat protein
MASTGADSTVWMWNAPKAACMMVFGGHSDAVTCGGFTPDGKKVYTGSADCTVKLWNPKTGAATTTFGKGHQDECFQAAVTSVSAAKGAPMLLSGSVDGKMLLLHRQTGKVVGKLEHHTDSVETVAFAPDPSMGASGSMDNDVVIWDFNTLKLRVTCRHDEGVNHILWHPSEPQLFLTGSIDGIVRLWDCRTGEEVRKWTGHRDCCLGLALTADGKHVVSGSDDSTAKMFSLV